MGIGPTLTFDKSFIESLSLNEAFWLDNFFMTNIAPIFYVETIADLEKKVKKGKVPRSSDDIVKEIADKSPIIGSVTNVHYQRLIFGDLLGKPVEMDSHHRPIIAGGLYKISSSGDINVNYEQSHEAERQQRWTKHEFLDVEREVAMKWKEAIDATNLNPLIERVIKEISDDPKISNLEDIRTYTGKFVESKYNQFIHFALDILDIPDKYRRQILKRWYATRPMSFNKFAPYAAYVLSIDLLFFMAINRGFLSTSHKRKSTNIIDLSYLYYLPFCYVFVSSDSFHKRLAPMFMDSNQMFISGDELKQDLKNLNNYYSAYKDEINKVGSMRFATYPPLELNSVVARIFDKYFKSWRQSAKSDRENLYKPIPQDKELLKRIKDESNESQTYVGPPIPEEEVKSMTLKRMVPVRKGDWRILPEGIEFKKSE